MGGCRGVGGQGDSRGQQKKEAGNGWEAAGAWEAGYESRGQKKKEAGKG